MQWTGKLQERRGWGGEQHLIVRNEVDEVEGGVDATNAAAYVERARRISLLLRCRGACGAFFFGRGFFYNTTPSV
jgi:hypothetical protein